MRNASKKRVPAKDAKIKRMEGCEMPFDRLRVYASLRRDVGCEMPFDAAQGLRRGAGRRVSGGERGG